MSGFQLKDYGSIAAAMMNHAKATQNDVTDFEIGSVVRTLMESSAIELDELYQKVFSGILDAIPTSIYKAFDFELIGKAAARGTVTVTFGGPIVEQLTIPAGTVFVMQGSSLKFTSVLDVVVPVGALSATVVVVCAIEGTAGNVDANAITGTDGYTMPAGASLTNNAFTSGTDGQTEAERKARFVEFIQSLSRGTLGSIRYAVRQARIVNSAGVLTEYVSRIGHVEVPGRANFYIYGSSGTPSAALVAAAQTMIDGTTNQSAGTYTDGYRALGVEVVVSAMVERTIPVSLRVSLMSGVAGSQDLKNAIATLLEAEFEGVESGTVLYVDQLLNATLTLPGVRQAVAGNNANIACGANEVLKLGALTVEWIDA